MSMTVSVFRPRKSNFTRPAALHVVLVVLGDDVRVVREARHVIPQRAFADHDARSVHAGVAREPFELLRLADQLATRSSASTIALSFGSCSSACSMVAVLPCPWSGTRLAMRCASGAGNPIVRATSLITLRALRFW